MFAPVRALLYRLVKTLTPPRVVPASGDAAELLAEAPAPVDEPAAEPSAVTTAEDGEEVLKEESAHSLNPAEAASVVIGVEEIDTVDESAEPVPGPADVPSLDGIPAALDEEPPEPNSTAVEPLALNPATPSELEPDAAELVPDPIEAVASGLVSDPAAGDDGPLLQSHANTAAKSKEYFMFTGPIRSSRAAPRRISRRCASGRFSSRGASQNERAEMGH